MSRNIKAKASPSSDLSSQRKLTVGPSCRHLLSGFKGLHQFTSAEEGSHAKLLQIHAPQLWVFHSALPRLISLLLTAEGCENLPSLQICFVSSSVMYKCIFFMSFSPWAVVHFTCRFPWRFLRTSVNWQQFPLFVYTLYDSSWLEVPGKLWEVGGSRQD